MIGAMEKQITPHVHQVGTFEFTQYLIGGPPYFLMEGGIAPQGLLILEQLRNQGVTPENLQYLGILHGHFDHLGTFPLVMENFPETHVVSGEKNRDILSRPRILEKIASSTHSITDFAKRVEFVPRIYEQKSFSPFPIQHPIQEGDTLTFDSLSLEFVSLPGHSPDAVGAYLSEDGVFFCSDMGGLYFPDGTIRPNYYYNLRDYETSLQKISTYEIETLCFGHNGVLSGYKKVKTYLERSLDFTHKLKKQIKDWFDSGRDLEKLAQQFADGAKKGFLAFFPREHSLMLSRLLIRRTLEYYHLELPPNLFPTPSPTKGT